jgi:uncharacterized protein YndB with AHSA1/START domain
VTRTATLVHSLERSIVIHAQPEVVFRFFTDTSRWASWWGAGSTIDPRAGGRVLIRYPDGTEAAGSILEIAPPARLVFTYGYVTGSPIEPGGSMVTIRLEAHPSGTRLHLTHAFADPSVRDHHVQGWRYQLSLFANAIANEQHAGAGALTDQWFAAWSEEQPATREAMLRAIATPALSLRDKFSAIDGIDDVLEHLAAARRFMPGLRMARDGHVRQCQGLALADWVVTTAPGDERGRGTNLFVFSADGRIESVTGFWRAGPA